MKVEIPNALRQKLQKAGRARAAQITTKERQKFGRKAWQTRLRNAVEDAK